MRPLSARRPPAPSQASAPARAGHAIAYQPKPRPRPHADDAVRDIAVPDVERLLESWFGRPVVLLSSGRTGLRVLLQAAGFDRYRNRMWVPPFLSRCVMNAVTLNAFPIDQPRGADGALLYHQFGFQQVEAPQGFVVEDLAHAFFGSPRTGSRQWLSEASIFSLPKFFPVAGLVGGVVTSNRALADEVRALAAATPTASPDVQQWMRHVYATVVHGEGVDRQAESVWIDSVYELLFHHAQPDPLALQGFPLQSAGLSQAGERRAALIDHFLDFFRGTQPSELWTGEPRPIAWALPYFARHGRVGLMRASAALGDLGVEAGIYHIDVRRSMARALYRECLLIPCHQHIAPADFEEICRTIARSDQDET